MPKQSYVSWLQDLTSDQLDWIGRKAARLSEMIKAGLPVPKGFVLFPQAFYTFLAADNLKQKIQAQIRSIDPYNPLDLEMAADRIKTIIMATPVPKPIALAVFQAVGQLGQHQAVAIRGSSSHSAFSTAHQQPKLAVSGDAAILDGIRQVWSELLSPRNIQAIFHQSLTEYPFSIIVEQMIGSEVGGEIFTSDPGAINKNTLYINAALGIRDEYIKRYNYPDLYAVDTTNFTILEKVATPQRKALSLTAHGVSEETVFPPFNTQPKLTDSTILTLSRLGKKIQNLYFFPQKIEFAVLKNSIFILDTQPIGVADQVYRPTQGPNSSPNPAESLCHGVPINPGLVTAPLRIVSQKSQIKTIKPKDIVVLPNTALIRQIPLRNLSGLVIESASTTDVDIIYCKNVGIPSLIGSIDNPKNGQIVTLDATQGFVYPGSRSDGNPQITLPAPASAGPKSTRLATKLYLSLTNPADLTEIDPDSWAGLGLIRIETILQNADYDPTDFFAGPHSSSHAHFVELLKSLMQSAGNKPLLLRLNDPIFKGESARSLNRGAIKYQTNSQPLEVELNLIASAFSQIQTTRLKIVVPFVRDRQEVEYFLKIYHQIMPDSSKHQLLAMIETPSAALTLNAFSSLPLEGYVLGLNDLTALTLAINRSDPIAATIYPQSHESISQLIRQIAATAASAHKTLYVSGEGILDSYDVLKNCLQSGVSGLCVPSKRLPALISQIAALELAISKGGHG